MFCIRCTYKLAQYLLLLGKGHVLALVVATVSFDYSLSSAKPTLKRLARKTSSEEAQLALGKRGNSQKACIFCRANFAF